MPSIRQIEANRSNAKRSTGPKTTAGKVRSSHNALRHGLARSAIGDPGEAENFAVAIASAFGNEVTPDSAMALAWSKLALLRIRSLRQAMLAALLTGPLPADLKRLKGLERYDRAALVQQRRTLRSLRLKRGALGFVLEFGCVAATALPNAPLGPRLQDWVMEKLV